VAAIVNKWREGRKRLTAERVCSPLVVGSSQLEVVIRGGNARPGRRRRDFSEYASSVGY